MKRSAEAVVLAAALSACAGPSATGQTTPQASPPVGRIHAYEVPVNRTTPPQSQEQGPGWIQVNGTGSVSVAPDRARVSFAVESQATTAAEASGANADVMDAVFSAIRAGGFAGLSLETFGYSLRPDYSNNNDQRGRQISSYTAVNNVGATVEDVNGVGRVIDAAISAGANRVASISFFASDTEEARQEALAMAVRNARTEARIIAESLGYQLGAALEVTGGAQRPIAPYENAGMALASRRADTPIEAGEQTVNASVSVRFALGPELGG